MVASLDFHMEMQHDQSVCAVDLSATAPALLPVPLLENQLYFTWTDPYIDFLVKGWPGRATSFPNLRMYFMQRHMEYTIVILN